jgi:hypothetical protein
MTKPIELHEAQPIDRLSILALEIRRAHDEVEQHARKSLEMMIMAGEKLIEAKEMLRDPQGRVRGHWGPWLRDQCKVPPSTARLYMSLARHKATILENANVSVFSVRAAREWIAEIETAQQREAGRCPEFC